jgi:PTH1 family peptidyl-tRNA hydrolase
VEESVGRIIVGLGNPGHSYADTRHNVGFWFVDYLAHHWNLPLFNQLENVLITRGKIGGREVYLAKPTTYMNRSGHALVTLSRIIDFENSDLLVCHDELDIPVGKFKLKEAGGPGSHKGVISIHEYTGEEVARLKFGIYPEEKPRDIEAFVLKPFEKTEENTVFDLFPRAMDAVKCLMEEGVDKAMSLYNCDVMEQTDQED